MWCEINVRVNYPIKAILVDLMDKGEINLDCPLHLFCTSWLSLKVAFVGIKLLWNHHPIPGMTKSPIEHVQYIIAS